MKIFSNFFKKLKIFCQNWKFSTNFLPKLKTFIKLTDTSQKQNVEALLLTLKKKPKFIFVSKFFFILKIPDFLPLFSLICQKILKFNKNFLNLQNFQKIGKKFFKKIFNDGIFFPSDFNLQSNTLAIWYQFCSIYYCGWVLLITFAFREYQATFNKWQLKLSLSGFKLSWSGWSILFQCIWTLVQRIQTLVKCIKTLFKCIWTLVQYIWILFQCINTLCLALRLIVQFWHIRKQKIKSWRLSQRIGGGSVFRAPKWLQKAFFTFYHFNTFE